MRKIKRAKEKKQWLEAKAKDEARLGKLLFHFTQVVPPPKSTLKISTDTDCHVNHMKPSLFVKLKLSMYELSSIKRSVRNEIRKKQKSTKRTRTCMHAKFSFYSSERLRVPRGERLSRSTFLQKLAWAPRDN